ncbi:DUF2617 family protein [Actinobacteria bacterium YIM 96077]|uniref:DUF2617 domain-containing protein n=1 Tax=Phytoactinopolyspora halophila TaxID=1981511 RepID=A0A329QH94_9ACTN|nr:DUF2617 family protein [Phytoactinopolyspora halophila]AYY13087.1 DUF2617 family protein [Actinobacteria bacterium YIM 96077]RAW11099.1 DUF2617 domain-containing protein [Phytoactinopolyspora halophila]
MLSTLDVPYIDTDAAELVWTLGYPLAPALSTTAIRLGHDDESRLELRVLGASHQAALCWPGGELIETVACLPNEQPHLPSTMERRVDGRRYRFRARVETVSVAELRSRADTLRQLATQDGTRDTTVLAVFPSEPDAVTALSLDGVTPGVSWNTWHLYPNSGQIVTTSTEVR